MVHPPVQNEQNENSPAISPPKEPPASGSVSVTEPHAQSTPATTSDGLSEGSLPGDGIAGISTRSGHLPGDQSQRKAEPAKKIRAPRPPPRKLSPKEEFFERLRELQPGSDEFMKEFELHEQEYFENPDFHVNVHENGTDFYEKLKIFDEIHLVKDKNGLGMVAPLDFSRKTILKYVSKDTVLGINYSNNLPGEQLDDSTMGNLLKQFEIPRNQREKKINSIAFEFSGTDLGKRFQEPQFVENGIVQKLRSLLQKLPKNKEVNESLKMMPKYTKFLIISMAGSFTDVHFDFSATSVFYHVFEGQKVFYVAPNTEENLEKFMKYQKGNDSSWIGTTLSKQWKWLVINPGQTAFIPGGHLHFVYTPVDSLVIGGNFMMEKDIELGFKCTKHEEDLLKDFPVNPTKEDDDRFRSHMFQGFRSMMWGYVEHIFLPKLRECKNDESIALAKFLVADSRKKKWPLGLKEWYSEQKRTDLLKELKGHLGIGVRKRKEKATIMDGDEENISEVSTAASTSAASDAKRRQKTANKKAMKNDKEESLEDIEATNIQNPAQQESPSRTFQSESISSKMNHVSARRPAKRHTSATASSKRRKNETRDPVAAGQKEKGNLNKEPSTTNEKDLPTSSDLGPETQKLELIKDKMELDLANAEEIFRKEKEKTPPVSSTRKCDFDGVNQEQQTMNSIPKEDEKEEDRENNDKIFKEKKKSHPVHPVTSSKFQSLTNSNGNNPGSCPLAMPALIADPVSIVETNATKQADGGEQPTTTAADSERNKSNLVDGQVKVHQAKTDGSLEGEKENTSNDELAQPDCSPSTSSNNLITSVPNRFPPAQEKVDIVEATSEKDQPFSNAPDLEKNEWDPNTESMGKVQKEKMQILGEQKRTSNNKSTQPALSLNNSFKTTTEEDGPASDLLPSTRQDVVNDSKVTVNEDYKLPSAVTKNQILEPDEEPMKELQNIQEVIQQVSEVGESSTTPSDKPVQAVSTLATSSNCVNHVIESSLLRHSATQTTDEDAMKVEEEILPLSVLEEKTPEVNEESLGKVQNVHAKTLVQQEATLSDEIILPTSSPKVPEQQATAPTTPISLSPVTTTYHLADMQNMPTSSKLLSQQELSSIALLPREQPSRELLIAQNMSLLKEKRQALSAIVMQELDDTQLMQIVTLLHTLPVNVPSTQNLHKSGNIAVSGQRVSDKEKAAYYPDPARNEEDQVENGKTAAANNREVQTETTGTQVDFEKEKAALDLEKKTEEQTAQLERMASSSFFQHYQLVNLIESLQKDERHKSYHGLALQMTAVKQVARQIHQMVGMKTSHPKEDGKGPMEKDDEDIIGNPESSTPTPTSDAALRQTAIYQHTLLIDEIIALPSDHQAGVFQTLGLMLMAVQQLVQPKQEVTKAKARREGQLPTSEEVEEIKRKRTADDGSSPRKPATKKTKPDAENY